MGDHTIFIRIENNSQEKSEEHKNNSFEKISWVSKPNSRLFESVTFDFLDGSPEYTIDKEELNHLYTKNKY